MYEAKLKEMGIELELPPKPLAAYVPAVKVGDYVFTSGQIPMENGELKYAGKVGKDVSVEEAQAAAKLCALNALKAVKSVAGTIDKIEQIVKLTVFVNSPEGFTDQPKVANGASEFMQEVFGEAGKHSRAAVGVNELPINSAVEIEMIVKLKGE
jgi:enamine deaminase RidA (YjgF/YER057c/UK114 family)